MFKCFSIARGRETGISSKREFLRARGGAASRETDACSSPSTFSPSKEREDEEGGPGEAGGGSAWLVEAGPSWRERSFDASGSKEDSLDRDEEEREREREREGETAPVEDGRT